MKLTQVLSWIHAHPRDQYIRFEEVGHRYFISTDPCSQYTSVTTWVHHQFEPFDADKVITNMMKSRKWREGHKYWGMTPQEIKDQWEELRETASSAGTEMHANIECFHNNPDLPEGYTNGDLLRAYLQTQVEQTQVEQTQVEWQYFLQFIRDHPDLKPYRTEWCVYDETTKICGSIDMVYENTDGTLSIYDWKRAKQITRVHSFNEVSTTPALSHLPNTNFWHYALQLNLYKYILETHYGKKIRDLCLVRLHPECEEQTYELIPLPDLSREIHDGMEAWKANHHK